MTIEGLLSTAGLGEFVAQDFFVVQVGLLGGGALLFVLSLILCLMAFRAAKAAKEARGEAEVFFQSAQDLAGEVRHLTAQVEKTANGERAPLSDATDGIVDAFVPEAAELDSLEPTASHDAASGVDTRVDTGAGSQHFVEQNDPSLQVVAARKPPLDQAAKDAGPDNALSFVDGDESLLREPAKDVGFVGEGIPSGEYCDEHAHDLAARDAAGEQSKPSPLSSLLRRRRF